ncbi:hypothetical protein [Rhodopirellula bahusiensis]|uniref:hypothetical protein n=1 Tax=Rhodopirellula bahusiensis TaxID=2014065 RepID=UPI003264AA48
MALDKGNFENIFAEIAAMPLVSENAFLGGFTGIPFVTRDPVVAEFYAEIETFSSRFELSIDQINSLQNWIWWGDAKLSPPRKSEQKTVIGLPLEMYLPELAKHLLVNEGFTLRPTLSLAKGAKELCGDNRERYARQAVASLSRSMPFDVLETALNSEVGTNTLAPNTYRLLSEKGFAEPHLHLGASIDFEEQWRHLQANLLHNRIQFDFLSSPHGTFSRGEELGFWLLVSAIVRYLLAKYISQVKAYESFGEFLFSEFDRIAQRGANVGLLRHVIRSLAYPVRHPINPTQQTFASLQNLYQQIASVPRRPVVSLSDLNHLDPVSLWMKPPWHKSSETQYFKLGLRFLIGESQLAASRIFDRGHRRMGKQQDDAYQRGLFRRLFWQTQRARAIFYRHVVQRTEVGGLVWFTRYYRRISPSRKLIGSDSVRAIAGAINNGLHRGLRSFEVRSAPSSDPSKILDDLNQVRKSSLAIFRTFQMGSAGNSKATENGKLVREMPIDSVGQDLRAISGWWETDFETGLVYHFVKERELRNQDQLSTAGADRHDRLPAVGKSGFRFSKFAESVDRKAKAICHVLRTYPLSLIWLRGIDICNDELAIPTWVFAKAYRDILHASRDSSRLLYHAYGMRISPIRPNSHVGEDFSHLLTGLRRIDEAIEILGIGENDRIGHALALGTDAKLWCSGRTAIPMKKEERLFDLVWAWATLETIPAERESVATRPFEREILELIENIFGEDTYKNRKKPFTPTVSEIYSLTKNLYDPGRLQRVGFPNSQLGSLSQRHNDSERWSRGLWLLHDFLQDRKVVEKATSVKLIDPSNDLDFLDSLQESMRQKVASKGITVEVNPTSNVVVGNIKHLGEHPFLRLNRPNYADSTPPVSIVIGSDDPLVFATNLPDEYQRVVDALADAGYSQSQIEPWIDGVRQCSLDVRNTLSVVNFSPIRSLRID